MPSPHRSALATGILLAAASLATAQVGIRDVDLVNTTGIGSPVIATTFVYPAQHIGRDAPLRRTARKLPSIVMLHGFGRIGAEYHVLASDLAARGFVVALPNTGQISIGVLENDAIALLAILRDEARDKASFLYDGIDIQRTGLLGHSYGGSTCARVLARNLGYRAGLAIAPVHTDDDVQRARAPFAVIHGDGDSLVPVRDGSALYRAATSYRDLKFFAKLDVRAKHMNVAGMMLLDDDDREVWALCSQMILSFFASFLEDEKGVIQGAIGPAVRRHPLVGRLDLEVDSPQLWHEGSTKIGETFTSVLSAEPGPYVIYVGLADARISTPFGVLGLRPDSLVPAYIARMGFEKTHAIPVTIPRDNQLVGKRVLLQSLATRARTGLRLSAVDCVEIGR